MITEHTARVNVMWDVLNGCPWQCAGCHIDKTAVRVPNDKVLIRLSDFIFDMRHKGYPPDIVTLGPVDVACAENTIEFLQDDKVKRVLSHFQRIAMPTRMLTRSDALIEVLNKEYPGTEIEFQMVVDVPQFYNDKYLQIMSDNMKWYQDNLNHKVKKFYPIFNLYEYINSEDSALTNYQEVNKRCYQYFNFGVDYAFSFSRLDSLDKPEVFRLFAGLRDMFDNHVTKENTGDIHFAAGHHGDSSMITVAVLKEQMFFVPVVYEHYVTALPDFKIDDWRYSGVQKTLNHLSKIALRSNLMSSGPCGPCEYVGVCHNRMGVAWMEIQEIKECIIPKKAYQAMN